MATIMFVPVRTAMQILCWLRTVLAAASITWISLHNPEAEITGYLGDLVTGLLPGSTYLNLIIPALGVEVLINILFLVGIGQHSRPWLVPWLVINLLILASLVLTVLSNCAPMFLDIYLTDEVEEESDEMENSLEDIERFLRILSLNMISMGQLLNLSGGLKLFLDMKYRRRISFSKKIEKKEIARDSFDESKLPPPPHIMNLQYPIEEISPIFKDESKNPNVMVTLDEEGSKSESWDEKDGYAVVFSMEDEDNFA